jgi:hypothetical protein
MHYSKTRRERHEREFLRHRKVIADGGELELDSRDQFALIELDKRTDRWLSSVWRLVSLCATVDRGRGDLRA